MKINSFLLIVSLLVVGCTNKVDVPAQEVDEIVVMKVPASLVQQYALSDTFIDVDAKAFSEIITNPDSLSTVNSDDIAKMKAALYRFYKNVKLEDGIYICDIEDGKSINISESLFVTLKENLQKMNDGVKEAHEKGIEVVQSKPDSAYLNSLLN
ncbi:MAG: hypothetical protein K2H50_05005 [Paramuribaculum sp.]|nr:hypothetical protein [Paramuribaculum sp.]